MKTIFTLALVLMFTMGHSQNQEIMETYVIEVTSFKYAADVDGSTFWTRDAEIEADYTKLQPGFISRESGYSKSTNEVVVVVRWKTLADADASMQKFMGDESVKDYAEMIDGPTMKMNRYEVK